MTQPTPSLARFLLARISEDEAAACGTSSRGYCIEPVGHGIGTTVGGKRLRAECEAKKAQVSLLVEMEQHPVNVVSSYAYHLLCLLAAPYSDHPDFREEWQV